MATMYLAMSDLSRFVDRPACLLRLDSRRACARVRGNGVSEEGTRVLASGRGTGTTGAGAGVGKSKDLMSSDSGTSSSSHSRSDSHVTSNIGNGNGGPKPSASSTAALARNYLIVYGIVMCEHLFLEDVNLLSGLEGVDGRAPHRGGNNQSIRQRGLG